MCRHSTYGLGGDVMYKAQAEKHRAVLRTVSNTQITRGSNLTGDFSFGRYDGGFKLQRGFRTGSVRVLCPILFNSDTYLDKLYVECLSGSANT